MNQIPTDTRLVVTSFAWTNDGIPERVFYIVKQERDNLFLKRSMRATSKSSWTPKLKSAALFVDANKTADFLKRIFPNVRFDL